MLVRMVVGVVLAIAAVTILVAFRIDDVDIDRLPPPIVLPEGVGVTSSTSTTAPPTTPGPVDGRVALATVPGGDATFSLHLPSTAGGDGDRRPAEAR